MNVLRHVAEPVDSLLDVGCNAGIWLRDCSNRWPRARLAGIDINQSSLEKARALLASVEIRCAGAENIPFPDQSFDYVTFGSIRTSTTGIEIASICRNMAGAPASRKAHYDRSPRRLVRLDGFKQCEASFSVDLQASCRKGKAGRKL